MTQFICPKTSRKLIVNKDDLLYEDGTFAYKTVNNIPRFVEIDNYADAFGLQWNSFPKTQLDSFTNTNISENRLKLSFGNDLKILKGKKILEAGCGAGKFTEILSKELHYEWSRLDTHDRNTDHFKRHIRISKIGEFLDKIGGHEITAGTRRPGVA